MKMPKDDCKYPVLEWNLFYAGISKKRFSEMTGINYNTLRKMINGEIKMDVESAIKIAKTLSDTVENVFNPKGVRKW